MLQAAKRTPITLWKSTVSWDSTSATSDVTQKGLGQIEGTALASFEGRTISSLTFTLSPSTQPGVEILSAKLGINPRRTEAMSKTKGRSPDETENRERAEASSPKTPFAAARL